MKRVRATEKATVTTTRVECNKKSNGFGGKSDGNKGGGKVTASRAMATVMATT